MILILGLFFLVSFCLLNALVPVPSQTSDGKVIEGAFRHINALRDAMVMHCVKRFITPTPLFLSRNLPQNNSSTIIHRTNIKNPLALLVSRKLVFSQQRGSVFLFRGRH